MSANGPRSRFGCSTCRKRKVKCDEAYPKCRRCTQTGRKCDGPSQTRFMFVRPRSQNNSTRNRPLSRSLGGVPNSIDVLKLSDNESRVFHYFLNQVGPRLAGAQDASFWTHLVPQICHTDVATRYAVMVISQMFENPPETSEILTRSYPKAHSNPSILQWHNRSIKGYFSRLKTLKGIEKTELALLSCVLLTSIEYQQNNIRNAAGLLRSGYEIAGTLSQDVNASACLSPTIKDILVPMLARQTVLMTTIGCPPPDTWFTRFQGIAPTPITSISNLDEARAGLYTCLWKSINYVYSVHEIYALGPEHIPLNSSSPLRETQPTLLRDLGLWHRYFFIFTQDEIRRVTKTEEDIAGPMMLMYYHVAFIWVSSCLEPTQMHLDTYLSQFQRIVFHAEKVAMATANKLDDLQEPVPFSFEIGIVPPLHFTGLRCRHPLVRRRAIELMRNAPRQEALFPAELNAWAVKKIMELEEKNIRIVADSLSVKTWDGSLPPDEDRCSDATIHYKPVDDEDAVVPGVMYIRGTYLDSEGKAHHNRGFIPWY